MGDDKNSSSSGFGLLFKISLFILLVFIPAGVEFYLLLAVGFVPSQWMSTPLLISILVLFAGTGSLFYSKNLRHYLSSIIIGFVLTGVVIGFAGLAYLFSITLPYGINAGYLAAGIGIILSVALYFLYSSSRPTAGTTSITGLIAPSTKNQVSTPTRPALSIFKRRPVIVAGVELEEIPRAYVFPEEGKEPLDLSSKFLNIVRHLTLTDINFSLRIERKQSSTRVFFLTWSVNESMLNHQTTLLLDTLQSNLSGFKFYRISDFEGITLRSGSVGSSVEITGVPLSIEDEKQQKSPLDSVASVMQELDNGVLQVFLESKKDQYSELRKHEAEYRKLVESSETTVTKDKTSWFHGDRQESRRIVNPAAARNAELEKRKMERLSGSQLCEVRVVASSWDEKIESADIKARRIAGAVMGVVRPDTTQEDFQKRYRRKDKKSIAKLLRGLPVGLTTALTPEEAASYIILPKTDIGVRVTSRQRFSSGTKQPVKNDPKPEDKMFSCDVPTSVRWKERSRKIFHGNPIGESGEPLKKTYISSSSSYYDGHFLVVGTTRQGKTTTTLSMTAQLIAQGINPVVFAPAKVGDWRPLMEIFPDIRFFTPGSLVSLLGYNFWNPPPNVFLSKWVDMVVSIICLWLPNDKVITMHVEDWVYTIYDLCGWDIETETKGRPILFQDIVAGVLEFRKNLNYDEEVNRNFYGALVARVKSLLRKPALVRMFNTKSGISIPELLAHPTVIEMEGLSPRDRVLLMGMLTAAISEYKLANPTKKVENVLVLEEAHYLLGKADLEGKTNSSSRQKAVLTLVEMLRVLGGTGLGMVLIEQLPSSLVEEAMKLPVNLIIHRLKEDREITETIGAHAGCTDTQIQHLRGMKRGEAVVFVETEGEPKNVQILPLQFFIRDRLREDPPTDDEVKAHMKPILEKHPELARSEPLPEGLIDRLIKGAKAVENDVPENEFAFFFESENFTMFCKNHLDLPTEGSIKELVLFFVTLVAENIDGEVTTVVRLAERVVREYCENDCESVRQKLNYEILIQMKESG